jgi:hypothetical protein
MRKLSFGESSFRGVGIPPKTLGGRNTPKNFYMSLIYVYKCGGRLREPIFNPQV